MSETLDYRAISRLHSDALSKARRVKDEAHNAAYSEYTRVGNENQEKYSQAIAPARAEYDKVVQAAQVVRDEAQTKRSKVYDAAIIAADKAYEEAGGEIAADLLKEHKVPEETARLFSWMLSSGVYRNNYDACDIVLGKMPLNFKELEALRIEQGWCSDFNTYLGQAMDAGVFPDIDQVDLAEAKVLAWASRHTSYDDEKKKLSDLVDELVMARLAAVAASKTEDKAKDAVEETETVSA